MAVSQPRVAQAVHRFVADARDRLRKIMILKSFVFAGLVALAAPQSVIQPAYGFEQESVKLAELTKNCQVAAKHMLSDQCEGTYLIEFTTAGAKAVFDSARQDQLTTSLESMNLSAYELDGQELGLLARTSAVTRIVGNTNVSIFGTQTGVEWHMDRIEEPTVNYDGVYEFADDEVGAGVTIYIVDTGVNPSHTQFTGRIASGYSAIGSQTNTDDCNGHGTHVAGLAAGSSFGAAKQATIVPVRVLDCDGSGTLLGVLEGLDWIASNTFVGQPAVVNMSLGGDRNSLLDDAISNLSSQGLAFVVAAGNEGVSAATVSPAASPGAITVAASSRTDTWPSFSNYGSEIDIIAPGVQTRSAWITGNSSTAVASGTSMASAVVAGVVATQMSAGYQTPASLLAAIRSAGVSGAVSGAPGGTSNVLLQNTVLFDFGGGSTGDNLGGVPLPEDSTPIDDTNPIVEDPTPVPSDPAPAFPLPYAKPEVTVTGQSATAIWSIPMMGNPLSAQILKVYAGGVEVASHTLSGVAQSFVIPDLESAVPYQIAVAGINETGTGIFSELSDPFQIALQILGPSGGDFSAWVKKISDNQVKFYAKYPQIGDKIQFMVQQSNGNYRELAWLRVSNSMIDENGEYIGLQNDIYFIRTVTLREGKNRLRILVNGELLDRTRTYTL